MYNLKTFRKKIGEQISGLGLSKVLIDLTANKWSMKGKIINLTCLKINNDFEKDLVQRIKGQVID